MSDDLKLTPEQKRTQLGHAEAEAKRLRAELGLDSGGNGGPGGSLPEKVKQVSEAETLAELYEKMAPGERTKMFLEDRPAFDRMLEAVEKVGARKLFR